MLPIKKAIAIVVFVSTMVTGWVAPELVLPATAPTDVPPTVVIAQPIDPPPVEPDVPDQPKPPPPSNGRICYLTFDDGPDGKITGAMLDVLKQYGVKATFFVVGSKVDAYPNVLKRIKAEGHAIGNHTYTHNYSQIYSSVAAFQAELERTNAALERVAGVKSMIIRAPGGSTRKFRTEFMPTLSDLGYEYFDWNVDSQDAINRKQTASQMADRVVNDVARHKVANVLMHSINTPTSLKALPSIIERIQNMGYEFRVIGSNTKPVHFVGN